jgi:bifunctional non-homologous end joining protein LigD
MISSGSAFQMNGLGSPLCSLIKRLILPHGRQPQKKHDAGSFGEDVKHVAIREKDGHDEPYLFIDAPAGLMTCVQMGMIEFHGWGARIEDVEIVDRWVFHLDPDEGLDFGAVISAAF